MNVESTSNIPLTYYIDWTLRMYEVQRLSDEEKLCAIWKIVNPNLILNSKTLFLDRDGVIIVDSGYVNSMARVQVIAEIIEVMKVATDKHGAISIITNQAGVAHGYFTEAEAVRFNLELLNFLDEDYGIKVNNLLYCPSHPDARIKKYKKNCHCRKPNTGLFEHSLRETGSKAELSVFIGDQDSDRKAAESLNMQFFTFPDDFLRKKHIIDTLL